MHVVVYESKETWSENTTNVSSQLANSITKYKLNQFLSNAYIRLKLGPYINIMQHFKHSDNDIQIWMNENDNIIEKVQFSDVSTYLRCY